MELGLQCIQRFSVTETVAILGAIVVNQEIFLIENEILSL